MLLECVNDSLVGRLSLAVSLGVAWSGLVKLDPPFLTEVLEVKADELKAIICDYLFGDLEMIEFEMDGILAVGNVATILGLEFVCSLPNDLKDLVRTFPGRTELAGTWVFGILEDLS